MIISPDDISDEALLEIAKDWVISQLSDSETHPELEDWAKEVVTKMQNGTLKIEYSEVSKSIGLKTDEDFIRSKIKR